MSRSLQGTSFAFWSQCKTDSRIRSSFCFKTLALQSWQIGVFPTRGQTSHCCYSCSWKKAQKLYSTSSPQNSYSYLTAKGIWQAQGEAEALGLRRCRLQLSASLSRQGKRKPRASRSPQGRASPSSTESLQVHGHSLPCLQLCPSSAVQKAKPGLDVSWT